MAAIPPAVAISAADPASLRPVEIAALSGICVGTLEHRCLFPVFGRPMALAYAAAVRLPLALGAWIVAGTSLGWGHAATVPSDLSGTSSVTGAADLPVEETSQPIELTPEAPQPEHHAEERPKAPATRYAAMTNEACQAELESRGIPHQVLGPKRGMASPVRLLGPLTGVTFHTLLPTPERGRSSYEIFDCRLLLALDDFAKLLAAQDVTEVMYFSAYRPPPAGFPEGRLGERHDGGLAIDIGYFRIKNGLGLNVERDYQAFPGERPCTPGPLPKQMTRSSLALRKIACDAIEARLFNAALTPAHDPTHRDHFHFELNGAEWFVVR
jgi:hypothetical protein